MRRSLSWCGESDTFWREQVNIVTSFVDASNVYGSDEKTASALRSFKNGLLKVSQSSMLPYVEEGDVKRGAKQRLFIAGDTRARVVPGLTAMHTIFVLEHNRVAKELKKHVEELTDEQLYQISRAVVGAEMQNIAFGQYAELLLGNDMIKDAVNTYYDLKMDPSVSNEFATAAFRFGHSMVQNHVKLSGRADGVKQADTYKVGDHFKDPNAAMYRSGCEDILLSLLKQPSQTCDANFADSLRDGLFLSAEERSGKLTDDREAVPLPDLAARNVHRGRDHGLPGYMFYRRKCGHFKRGDCRWDVGPAEIPKQIWTKFKSLYKSPTDVDLFSGGMAERPSPGAAVGPTFLCLLREQFQRLMDGDRFFFAHRNGGLRWLFDDAAIGMIK